MKMVSAFLPVLGWLGLNNIPFINTGDFTRLIVRFGTNLLVIVIVVFVIYAKNSRRKDFIFSYIAISITVFTLCYLLESVELELGFALGLFAIFGIIRYRTDAIPIKEMTYLFVIIGISVVNALSYNKVSYSNLLFTNLVIIGTMWALEKVLNLRQEGSLRIVYEKVENLHAMNREELMQDLEMRTGVKIKRFEILEINYLRDIAKIMVYHDVTGQNGNSKK
ncbi:MAG: DUF4956 domain-containing protein [Draconibacterium sp.]